MYWPRRRDAVAGLQCRVQRVANVEDGVVDEHLDVLDQRLPIPQRPVQLGKAGREAAQHGANGGPLCQRLVEHAPPGAVAAHELLTHDTTSTATVAVGGAAAEV